MSCEDLVSWIPQLLKKGYWKIIPFFLDIVLNHISGDSLEFSHAVTCLRLLFEMLGCKLWLSSTLSPNAMRNTLLANEVILHVEFDFSKAVEMGYISPKLLELIKLFQSFGEPSQLLCLIFVERIIAAKVIEIFVKKFSQISHLTVAYVTGSNTSADALARNRKKEIMDSF
ncbi:unnamed protein product [Lathyrus sativus]|nr:unnamed protein product [Lathyrus sativus]